MLLHRCLLPMHNLSTFNPSEVEFVTSESLKTISKLSGVTWLGLNFCEDITDVGAPADTISLPDHIYTYGTAWLCSLAAKTDVICRQDTRIGRAGYETHITWLCYAHIAVKSVRLLCMKIIARAPAFLALLRELSSATCGWLCSGGVSTAGFLYSIMWCPGLIGSCLDLARPTRGRIVAAFHCSLFPGRSLPSGRKSV